MFWSNVKKLLSEKNIQQKDFAALLGMNVLTLKNQMSRNILPDVENAYKISSVLNTSVEYLVTGKESNALRLKYKTLVESLHKLTEEAEKVLS